MQKNFLPRGLHVSRTENVQANLLVTEEGIQLVALESRWQRGNGASADAGEKLAEVQLTYKAKHDLAGAKRTVPLAFCHAQDQVPRPHYRKVPTARRR